MSQPNTLHYATNLTLLQDPALNGVEAELKAVPDRTASSWRYFALTTRLLNWVG